MAEGNIQDHTDRFALQPLTLSTYNGFGKDAVFPINNNSNVGSFNALQYLPWLQSSLHNSQVTSNNSSYGQSVTSLVHGDGSHNFGTPRTSTSDRQGIYSSMNCNNLVSTFSTFLSRLTVNPYGSLPYITHASNQPNKMLPTSAIQRSVMEYSSFIYQKQIWQQAAFDVRNLMAVERYMTSNSIYSFPNTQKSLLHASNTNMLDKMPTDSSIVPQFIGTAVYTPPPSPTKESESCNSEKCRESDSCSDEDTYHTEDTYISDNTANLEMITPNVDQENDHEKTFYICKWEFCEKKFNRYVNLLSHERTHLEEQRPFVCEIESCGKRYKYLQQLKQHEYTHSQEKRFICRWQFCNKSYRRFSHYMRHEQTHSNEQLSGGLQSRKNEFKSFKKSQNHSRRANENQRIFICKKKSCGRSFKQLNHLQRHEVTHTRRERNFTCEFESCGKSYLWPDHLQRHRQSHSEERPFVCIWDSCGKTYKRREHLKRHERIHTGESFTCESPSCGKGFVRYDHFRNHQQYTHSNRRFKCKLCSKQYKRPDHLKRHERIHTGKFFICESPFCGKSFSRSDHFRNHQYTHSTEKLFKCKFCDKQFKRLNHCRGHEKTHSNDISGKDDNQRKFTRSASCSFRVDRNNRYLIRSRVPKRSLS